MGFSQWMETQLFSYLKGNAVATLNTNDTFEVALFSTSLTDAGVGTEITGNISNLTRQPAVFVDGVTSDHVQSNALIDFGSNDSGSTVNVQAIGIYNAANNLVALENYAQPVSVLNGSLVRISSGSLKIYLDRQ